MVKTWFVGSLQAAKNKIQAKLELGQLFTTQVLVKLDWPISMVKLGWLMTAKILSLVFCNRHLYSTHHWKASVPCNILFLEMAKSC